MSETPGREPPVVITDDMLVSSRPAPAGPPDGRADFERGMSYAPPLTLVLIALNVVVFIWQEATGALESREAIIAAGALSRPEVLQGEIWRLVTAMFLHGDIDHLVGNCMALYVLGVACEHAVSSVRMLALYGAAGVAGSLASLMLSEGPSVGASGAIFGVMAAVAVILHVNEDRFYVRDKRIAVVVAAWALFTVATGLLSEYVDNAAHVGGFLGGMLVAFRLEPIDRLSG